jgi:dienelactone hydrolase
MTTSRPAKLAVLVSLAALASLPAQSDVQRATVGFTTFTVLDSSRSWDRPIADAAHLRRWRWAPRPVRISMWYPAVAGTGRPMHVADYLADRRDRATFTAQVLDGDASLLSQATSVLVQARRDARRTMRPAPLILYSAGLNSFATDNAFLAESLASHGFAVASVAQLGQAAERQELTFSAADVETQARDVEAALAVLRRQPNIDASRLGVLGWSMGAVSTLVLQQRHPEVRAMAALDPSYDYRAHPSRVTATPGFALTRTNVPLLVLEQHSADATDAVADSLVYATRDIVRYPGVIHEDFSMGAEVSARAGTRSTRRSTAHAIAVSRDATTRVVAFMRAALLNEASQRGVAIRPEVDADLPAGRPVVRHLSAQALPLDPPQVALLIEREGLDSARVVVTRNAGVVTLREAEANTFAYSLLGGPHQTTAVALFKLNAELHPTSANAFDSLADGLRAAGDTAGVARAYRRVLELIDTDRTLSAETRETLRVNATRFLNGGVRAP